MGTTVRFWGVRGSIPAPLTGQQVEDKIIRALRGLKIHSFSTEEIARGYLRANLPFAARSTFGGNTSCVEVRCDNQLFILDMGTGLRALGGSLMAETSANHGLSGTVLQSHVHWDHIQGFPFWPHVYLPRNGFKNRFNFFGGRDWDKSLQEVLRGQMEHPVFPVELPEINRVGLQMEFSTVWDGWTHKVLATNGEVVIRCRKLNHPQETYGYRIEYGGHVVVYTTDHEPYGGDALHRPLVELVRDADLWITDCQYSWHEYIGEGGKPQKLGWGHSYPEYIAKVAQAATPKRVLTFHHDPAASDDHVVELATQVKILGSTPTEAAYEGLAITL